MSLHACKAIRSTPRREASSNATAVASSEAGEPSIPTRTGASPLSGRSSPWITATGQFACRTTVALTEPSTPRASNPRPAVPTTTISASSDILIRASAGLEYTSSRLIAISRSAASASSASLIACMIAFLPSSSSRTARESGYGTGGQVAVGVVTAWTTVSGTFRMAASRAAQRAAAFDAVEPSTATTMPRCWSGADISFSLHHRRRYKPDGRGS
ncbi:hypothetical protein A5704_16790 [Mycobacterium sp. E735]|nr:hypothetical protein A5704_16790 [Mycobacterium sp. E735]